jgi:hypothetical protein
MTDNALKPILYLKQNCPFCMKAAMALRRPELCSLKSGSDGDAR